MNHLGYAQTPDAEVIDGEVIDGEIIDDREVIVITPQKTQNPNVPPGFESLAEPQSTVVDIYFGGEYLTSQLATFTPEEIEFTNAETLVDLIPSILQPRIIESELSGSLPTHPELVCFYQGQNNCGELEPEIAAVIFDESNFRVDLFINPDYLSVQTTARQKYLPASDGEWSWLQTFNGATSGSNTQEGSTYSINSNSTLAFKENRLQIVSNYRKNSTLPGEVAESGSQNSIDTAVLRRDWQGMEYQLGYFRSNSGSFQFMNDSKIRGARVASSLDTREDLRQTNGNELVVFLRSRSEVSLYKDGRLISSRFYDAGNQTLDTSQLPGGAYDVTIQIRDSGGTLSEETRFYVKSSQLPPIDQALYFVEIGELLDPDDDSALAGGSNFSLLRGGYHSRFNDQLAYLVGASMVENSSALELGLTHLGRNYDLHLGTVVANGHRKGARLNFRSQWSGIYFNAGYRQIWNDDYDVNNPDLSDFIGPASTQMSAALTTLLPFGRLEFATRRNDRVNSSVRTHTMRYELPRFRFGSLELYSDVELTREDDVTSGLFTFELRFNNDHFTGQLRPQYTDREITDNDRSKSWNTEGIVSWRDQDLMHDKDLRLDVRAADFEERSSYGAEVDFATQTGRLRVQSEQVDNNGSESRRYNGNVFSSFMINNRSAKLGGRDQSQSALLIEINGDVTDASFDVLVDGSPRAVAYPGKTVAINLRPYQTYRITLRQQGRSFVEYEQQPRRVTLYPGNVVTLEWSVAELDIVFGRIINSDGQPVANALINGVTGLATTDDAGLFQAELRRDVNQLLVETINSVCDIKVPPYSVNQGIGNLGSLECELRAK